MLGKTVQVEYDVSRGAEILRDELSRYPAADEPTAGDSEARPSEAGASKAGASAASPSDERASELGAASVPDLSVRYRPVDAAPAELVNPHVHAELDEGFVMRQRTAHVRFVLEGHRLRNVDFYPASPSSALVARARRMLDMQHTTREERAGIIFHELVLVPAAHWMPDVAVVHAAAFADAGGRVTLIGGTGGVGKTSLALELCLHHGFAFVADDISFVGEDGHVWPNLAYPKIYAYNLEDDAALAGRVLGGRGLADRLHWMVHRRRGPAFVRRRVAPDVLYGSYSAGGGPLHRYVMLAREDRSSIDVSELSPRRAAAMSTSLMPAEYFQFHNHVYWHAFNRAVTGRDPAISVRATLERWEALLGRVLESASCLLVRVPLSIDHRTFKNEMSEMLTA